MTKPKKRLNLSLPAARYDELMRRAKENGRTVTGEINSVLEHGLRAASLEMVVAQSINRCWPANRLE